MRIAVILPSRGLMFSKTAQELLECLRGLEYKIYFSHQRPIPDCFNIPLNVALGDKKNTHFFFVEDDMVLDPYVLTDMLKLDKDVVAVDYPVSKKGQGCLLKDDSGRIIFSGTGCLLVKREVFNKLKKPYFRTDIKWTPTNYGKFIRLTAWPIKQVGYGLHDVNFGLALYRRGIEMTDLGRNQGQRKLVKLGEAGTNDGAHQIEEWTTVKPDYLYKQYQKFPVAPIGELEEVIALDGQKLTTSKATAKKLVDSGRANRPPKTNISIDFNGIDL